MSAEQARCDIGDRDWEPPAKRPDCDLDWGHALVVERDGNAGFACAGDTVLGAGWILFDRQEVRVGSLVCASMASKDDKTVDVISDGVRCIDESTNRGFLLSPERYELL